MVALEYTSLLITSSQTDKLKKKSLLLNFSDID